LLGEPGVTVIDLDRHLAAPAVRQSAGAGPECFEPRLHDLHLGFHRVAERRDDRASQRLQHGALGSQLSPPTEHGALLQKAPFSFDSSVWEIFWPLCSGMRLVLARPDGNRDSAYVVQTIREQQVTVVKFVPALLQQFIEQDGVEQCTSLTDVLNGGGELSAALARQVRDRLPWVRLHNVYGPTETTVDSTGWTLEPDMPVPDSVVPIGTA
jgi:non-ribosomal peptide synthetase component F